MYRFYVVVMLLLILVTQGACAVSPMPQVEGPRARLLPGIAEPRDPDQIAIGIHRPLIVGHFTCIELAFKTGQTGDGLAMAFLPVAGSFVIECANVPTDAEVEAERAHRPYPESLAVRPWCDLVVPAWDGDYWYTHGMRHCMGWNHPLMFKNPEDVYVSETDRL